MKGIIFIFLVIFNLLLIFSIISFDNKKEYSIYASQMNANSTENENADDTDLFTYFENFKSNATESPSIKVNATKTTAAAATATKPNATETTAAAATATKPNVTETTAAAATAIKPKSSESPYAAAIAKLQPGDKVKYCYSFHSKFGSLGSGEGQFNRPHDIVFDSKGYLYINDRELNKFQKFSPDAKFISSFGEKGSDLGQYSSPYSMAIDANDIIYVLDRGNDRIVKVDTNGKVLGALYSYDGQWITSNDQIQDATKKRKDENG